VEEDGEGRTDRVKHEGILPRVKEKRNILPTMVWRKANSIDHIMRRNSFLKHVIEGKVEGKRILWRRHKQLGMTLRKRKCNGLRKRQHYMERSGRGREPVVRETTLCLNEWMNEWINGMN